MNYKIIQDEKELDRFLSILPETTPDEKYYLSLFSRRKYDSRDEALRVKADKGQLKRFLASKSLIKDKIKQLEVEVGAYKFEGNPIPQEILALYIMPNPRSMRLATRKSLIKFAELLANDNVGYNPYQEVLSQIQVSKSRGIWIDFDFDSKECPNLDGILNKGAYRTLVTKNGFHVLVEFAKIEDKFKKTFHQKISQLGPDVTGDTLLPVPGCVQGGFVPYILS